MYAEDSFLTLSLLGQVGLACLSLVLAIGTFWGVGLLGRGRRRATRLGIAVLLFWAFLWLSPQVYYLYYMTLFDGLPWQIVVKAPPSLTELLALLSFTDAANLSNHSKGVLGWALIVLSLRQKSD